MQELRRIANATAASGFRIIGSRKGTGGRRCFPAAKLGLTLIPRPAYSPDLNPIENLWRWMREEVTRNDCHPSMRHHFDACKAFIERINAHPGQVVIRLRARFGLDAEY